ncbi:SseB family protein [Gryllotalpicola ginsengisoli]|uniref:SseB family protein n=1 Tax=Gryllotalpicola ginsengisoli TaxID=444608 RepID=UPI0003B3909B|nr:SseB family protein [Gryllotalpicola ginsengisoli]
MRPGPAFPRSYVNRPVQKALAALVAEPGEQTLEALLRAALKGGLTVDVTGSPSPQELRLRTLQSTDGRPVLPLFSSLAELEATAREAAEPESSDVRVEGIIVPGRQALGFITTADFVAVQFDPRHPGGVIARAHVERALGIASSAG